MAEPSSPGLLRALLDAILMEDDQIGGLSVTRLTAPLLSDGVGGINVETSVRFGEVTAGAGDALLLVGGEIISAATRTDFSFDTLTRALQGSQQRLHPTNTLVYDLSQNRTAMDALRRGFLVDYAEGTDLDAVGRNLGVDKCRGLTQEQWRDIIRLVAYGPKQPLVMFRQILDIVFPGRYEVIKPVAKPWTVIVNIEPENSGSLKGKFFLNGGEPQLTTGLLTVETDFAINNVLGVVDDAALTRRGWRSPSFTNYFTGGSFVGTTITLGSSPGPIGTPVLVDYGAFKAHYTAEDFDIVEDEDFYAYVSDDSALVRCLIELVQAHGIEVEVGIKIP
jgi:hypothetical protein